MNPLRTFRSVLALGLAQAVVAAASVAPVRQQPVDQQAEAQADPSAIARELADLVAGLGAQAELPPADRLGEVEAFVLATHDDAVWLDPLVAAFDAAERGDLPLDAWRAAWRRTQAGDWIGWGEDAQSLELEQADTAPDGTVHVPGRFLREGKDPYEAELVFVQKDGAWKLRDLVVSGRSTWQQRAAELAALVEPAAAPAARPAAQPDAQPDVAGLLTRALQVEAARVTESPLETVAGLHATLLDVMQRADELGYAGRYARLAPVVRGTHDLDVVAYLTIRRAWGDLDAAARSTFTDTFRELSIATYAARFAGYGGERFERGEPQPGARGGFVVPAVIVKRNGERISLEYILNRRLGRWLILNVVADGVSDLALKTAEYGAVLEKDGFGKLLALLRARIAEQSAKRG